MTQSEKNGVESHPDQPANNGVPLNTALVPLPPRSSRIISTPVNPPLIPAFLSAKPNSWLLLRALRRRWLLATTLGLLAAAAAAVAVWFFVPTTYTAETYLILAYRPTRIVGGEPDVEFNIYQRSQAALVKNRFVLNRALGQPGVPELSTIRDQRPNEVEWLQNSLQVDFGQSPEIMRISLVGETRDHLVRILKEVSDAYLDETVNDELDARNKRLQKLKDAFQRCDDNLRTKRRTYKDLAESVGTSNSFVLAFTQQMKMEELQSRKRMLLAVQSDLMKVSVDASYQQAKNKDKTRIEVPAEVIDGKLAADAKVIEYEREIDKLKTKRKLAADGFNDGAGNPEVRKIEKQEENLRQALQEYRQAHRAAIADQLRAGWLGREQEALTKDFDQINKLKEMDKVLRADLEKLSSEIKESATKGVDMEGLKEEIDSADAIAKKLRDLMSSEEINLNMPPRVTRRQGEAPDARRNMKEDKQIMIAGGAGAGAMALVFLVIAYWEFLARRIATSNDVVNGLGWRLVGAIPDIPNRHRRAVGGDGAASKHWNSLLTESVDAARANLLCTAATEGVRSVMITSAVAGEGKTSLSCHLASSLARAGRRTLLIDGDLRRPSVHQMFDLPVEPGLAALLRCEAEVTEVIRSTPAPNLWIIPAGRCDGATLQALAEGKIRPLLDRLKEQFDFVIVDSSPVLPVVDALEMGQNVDVVIFSLLRDVSRLPSVYDAYERLTSLGIRVIGAVVNGVHQDRYGYAYRYYHSYGYTK